jgi:hypothetical protein
MIWGLRGQYATGILDSFRAEFCHTLAAHVPVSDGRSIPAVDEAALFFLAGRSISVACAVWP